MQEAKTTQTFKTMKARLVIAASLVGLTSLTVIAGSLTKTKSDYAQSDKIDPCQAHYDLVMKAGWMITPSHEWMKECLTYNYGYNYTSRAKT